MDAAELDWEGRGRAVGVPLEPSPHRAQRGALPRATVVRDLGVRRSATTALDELDAWLDVSLAEVPALGDAEFRLPLGAN